MATPSSEFVGPLAADQQLWSEETLAADSAAATAEPMSAVLQRRRSEVANLFVSAAMGFFLGDDQAEPTIRRAIAQARALAWLEAADPAGCWDCLLAAVPCQQHQPRTPTSRPSSIRPGQQRQPEWHRFGSEAS